MQTDEKAPLQCVEHHPPNTNSVDDGRSAPCSSDNVAPLQPVAAKRPTRQWAAWTREEEENFFTALRQVGKDFEKITYRVQSKNKEQVRHYYYRLVRRMNKLLDPGLCLDAKNSKDTNLAMLRWWSLLEKYSCKASKLHLKPRRFKIFVEALEHQLLKDRKKNVRKRSSPGENHSAPSATGFVNQNKSPGNDSQAVKIVLVESQNIQRAGPVKGSSTRRNSNIGVSRSSNKRESSAKSSRQRRKAGVVSAAAMKRWEKAAMAGVSLVADAAEHLERTAGGKESDHLGGLTVLSVQAVGCGKGMFLTNVTNVGQLNCTEQIGSTSSGQAQANLQSLTESSAVENNVQTSLKLKLQLFPIDESTRKALELEKHNPHLELTLSTKKKISSVLEHLDRKWGSSSVASGELMLFPFSIQKDNLLTCQRWTRDSVVTAAEVYAMIGSPPVFRLRYGWNFGTELQSATSETPFAVSSVCHLNERQEALSDQILPPAEGNHQNAEIHNNSVEQSRTAISVEVNKDGDVDSHEYLLESSDFSASMLSKRNPPCDGLTSRKMERVVDQRSGNTGTLSAGEWADSLTNVSVGDLLTGDSDDMDGNSVETPVFGGSRCLEESPFTCDSFDAAIAAHLSGQDKMGYSGFSPHSSSIWDAEETCDAFSFQKRAVSNKQVACSTASVTAQDNARTTTSTGSGSNVQDFQEEAMAEETDKEDPMDECPSEPHQTENSPKDFSSLTDIYWPDSLGPLELDVPSCKYYSEDLILSDSMSGLNRLIASSLDAFQNCSFFGLDEKEPSSSAAGAELGASFAGKIGTGDSAGVQSLQV